MAKRKPASASPKAKPVGKKRVKYEYEVAPDVQAQLEDIVAHLRDDFPHVDVRRVVCYRSRGSTARIYARIWSLPGIWQAALGIEPHYVIEVVERYDRSSLEEQEKTLIHELLHIPKNFSGNLVPHNCFGREINCEREDELHARLQLARAIDARARALAKLPPPPAPARSKPPAALGASALAAARPAPPPPPMTRAPPAPAPQPPPAAKGQMRLPLG